MVVKIKVFFILIILLTALFAVGCSTKTKEEFLGVKATIFKSPQCGCCEGYSSYLKQKGFDVEMVEMEDLTPIKQKYNIPRNMESCHTTVIGDHFIEGHMPIEAVKKVLAEDSGVEGIALPNMPAGAPGMPGTKRGTWVIYGISQGVVSEFMKL